MPPASCANDRWVSASTRSSGSRWTPSFSERSSADGVTITPGGGASARVLGAHGLGERAALVGAAGRAGGVRHRLPLALRAGGERRGSGLPLRPSRTGVAARHLALRNSHG